MTKPLDPSKLFGADLFFYDPEKTAVEFRPQAPYAAEHGPWTALYDRLTMGAFQSQEEAEQFVAERGARVAAFASEMEGDLTVEARASSAREDYPYHVCTSDGRTMARAASIHDGQSFINALSEAGQAWKARLGTDPGSGPGMR